MKAPKRPLRKIAILRPLRLGDTCLALPVLGAIEKLVPESKLIWIGSKDLHELVAGHPQVDEIWETENKPTLLGQVKLAIKMRKARLDGILILANAHRWRHRIAPWLARVPIRAGIANDKPESMSQKTKWMLTHQVSAERTIPLHEAERCMTVLEAVLGRWIEPAASEAYFTNAARDEAEAQIQGFALPARYIAVQLGFATGNRAIPSEFFGRAARRVLDELGLPAVLVGTKSEEDRLAEGFAKGYGAPYTSLMGKTGLASLSEALRGAEFLLSPDTGTAHLAATIGCPCVVLSPKRSVRERVWGPWKARCEIVRPDSFCENCTETHCALTLSTCVDSFSAERVLEASKRLIVRA